MLILHRNPKQTLSQNYKRLGLTARLNHATGGTEKTSASVSRMNTAAKDQDTLATSALNAGSSAISEATIERDPKTGSVLKILENGQNERANPLNDPLNDLEDSDPDEWKGFDNIPAIGSGPQTEVLSKLENLASSGLKTAPRKQSRREQEWIQKLVDKYNDDYGKMFRDVKLNPMQQSEGDIKRRVLKWKRTQEKTS